jgi:tetratricopeptide (TPR) repeat protein
MAEPEQLYARLVAAFREGRWRDADAIAQQLLPKAARHAGVYGIAGIVRLELGDHAQAAQWLGRATELDPSRADFATLHAKALMESRQIGDALRAADRALALALAQNDGGALDTLGVLYARGEQPARAAEAFRLAVAEAPRHAPFRANLVTALTTLGDFDGARQQLETTLALDAHQWPAHYALAQLQTQTAASHHVQTLQGLLERHGDDAQAQIYLNMALAKECEDLGDYAAAFEHLRRGKAAQRRLRPYDDERDRRLFDLLMQAFPTAAATVHGDMSEEPIFVVGLPRTGTTLVERVLSAHPYVHAAGELQNFAQTLQRLSGSPTPFLLSADLPARAQRIDWKALGAGYLASTRHATGHTPRFIDKLPHNFLYAGFIARALPRARIICLRRDPIDSCLSNFRQLFDQGSMHFDYACDLLDTGRYYVMFDRLMAHWQRVLPGRVLEVRYEDLTASPERTTRAMLAFCNLPWNDACLRIEDNPAPITTFSAVQARAPIGTAAVQRWKHYETQLAELRALLVEAGVVYS